MRIVSAINPRKVGLILGTIAILLAAQSIFTEYLVETYVGGNTNSFLASLLDVFSVNLEESIPTWYATLILFIAAGLLAVIAVGKRRSRDRFALYWTALAFIFVYLSMDEGAVMPESGAQARVVQTFGDLPLIVLSRGLDQKPDWQAMQVELLQLSSNSQQLIADKSDHNIEINQPEAAVVAIIKMIE